MSHPGLAQGEVQMARLVATSLWGNLATWFEPGLELDGGHVVRVRDGFRARVRVGAGEEHNSGSNPGENRNPNPNPNRRAYDLTR